MEIDMTPKFPTPSAGSVNSRGGSSRKLLMRKAREGARLPDGDALEDAFPKAEEAGFEASSPILSGATPADTSAPTIAPEDQRVGQSLLASLAAAGDAASSLPLSVQNVLPAPPLPPQDQPSFPTAQWSDEDEAAFQNMTSRRKAAGYQRRGPDVGGRLLCVGEIAPNPGTVVAAIVALVAEQGTITRAGLVKAMADSPFAHPKARTHDRNWCQGYVAGAIRDGFLVTLADPTVTSDATP